LSSNRSTAGRSPGAVGENRTFTRQVPPTGTGAPTQVFVVTA
jgi:hypothetical protein